LEESERQWSRRLPWLRGASILIVIALVFLLFAKRWVFG
jgi:hypothetical protein